MSNNADMKRKMPYEPEAGFFDDMRKTLMEIPDRHDSPAGLKFPSVRFPWRIAGGALAAVGVAALLVFVLVRRPSSSVNTQDNGLLTEQIEEYLADSGVSIYQLAEYAELSNQ